MRLDQYSRETYRSYYAPIEDLVSAAAKAHAWYHLDLFPLRETDARLLTVYTRVPANNDQRRKLAEARPDSRLHKSYEWEHVFKQLFDATIELIRDLQPAVVVVLNSYVSRTLHHKLPLVLQANGHRYECAKLPGIVFLLGSQLSGGATSTYAKERLLADLRDVVRGQDGLDGGDIARWR